MSKYLIIGSIFISVLLVGATYVISSNDNTEVVSGNNVVFENGQQIIEIRAKGGFSPSVSDAKADSNSVIKIITKGTFDCSSSVVIPTLGYEKNLPMTGTTLIDIPPQKAGTVLQGFCSMGMYNFEIRFS